MIDTVFQLLFRYTEPLSQEKIGLTVGNPKAVEEVAESLGKDDRFIAIGDDGWQAAAMEDLLPDQNLEDVEFVVTDLETTGPAKGTDRIIDIAALKVKNGVVIDSFESLVKPHQPISRIITRLTGISDEMVVDAPDIEDVLPKFITFAHGSVFVAHNAPFDFSFLNAEIRRIGLQPCAEKVEVCTFRMAKKLLPGVRACGLAGLSEHYEYDFSDRHRAMPDVLATVHFLNIFLGLLKEDGITTLYELIEFQKEALNPNDINRKIKKYLKKLEYKNKGRKKENHES
ncbi:MAG: exonuclease domain-containing protein [SAR324 cluster bacterium]|nr:exonuclease domain-containing protein [SAR324 cluster bacterium]